MSVPSPGSDARFLREPVMLGSGLVQGVSDGEVTVYKGIPFGAWAQHQFGATPCRGQPFRGRSPGATSKQSVVMPATLKDDRDARNDQRGDKDPDGVHRFVPPFLLEAMDRQTW